MKSIILLVSLLLVSCGAEDVRIIGYNLGFAIAYEATYEGNIGDSHYYRVANCNRTFFEYVQGRYRILDCRYYDIFRDYVVSTTYRISRLPLYYEQ